MDRIQNFFTGSLPRSPSRHYHGGKTLNTNNSSHLPTLRPATPHRQLRQQAKYLPASQLSHWCSHSVLVPPRSPAVVPALQSSFILQIQWRARGAGCTLRGNYRQGNKWRCTPSKLPFLCLPRTFWWEGEGEVRNRCIFPIAWNWEHLFGD